MINPTDRKPWALPHRLYLKSTINPGEGETNEENTVSGIVDLDARRLERSAAKSAQPSYQLGMRLEPSTFQDLLNLKECADVESFGELIRFALLEYERAVVDFDGLEEADGTQIVFGDHDVATDHADQKKGKDRLWTNTFTGHSDERTPSGAKVRRLNVTLSQHTHDRLIRLMAVTRAKTQSEVVRLALCVLDARIEQDQENASRLQQMGDQSKVTHVKRRG
jgi:hypothetical protein